jgi:ubiquinol-cytochrome c reductase iron-sulfur subunit
MTRAWRWFVALVTLLVGWLTRPARRARREPPTVESGPPDRRAENAAIALLLLAALLAAAFVAIYAIYSPSTLPNELLGLALGLCFASIAAALGVVAKRLVVTEELEEDYPQEGHPQDQQAIAEIVHESGSRITRKRLLVGAGATAGGALGLAALTPALSLGPLLDTDPLYKTPWRRGRRLVDTNGRPYADRDIDEGTFYTAFPEGADKDEIGAPVVVVRLAPSALRLPPERAGWAPNGLLAYSKVCTHAGCAIALYRKPTFAPAEPGPAFVCPCHYSTFDPATGGSVIFGPAGRALPQLPLLLDRSQGLRAAGNFSGPVGPSWWGVRSRRPT